MNSWRGYLSKISTSCQGLSLRTRSTQYLNHLPMSSFLIRQYKFCTSTAYWYAREGVALCGLE